MASFRSGSRNWGQTRAIWTEGHIISRGWYIMSLSQMVILWTLLWSTNETLIRCFENTLPNIGQSKTRCPAETLQHKLSIWPNTNRSNLWSWKYCLDFTTVHTLHHLITTFSEPWLISCAYECSKYMDDIENGCMVFFFISKPAESYKLGI